MKKLRTLNSTLIAATLCVVSAGWTAALAQDASSTPYQPAAQTPSEIATTSAQPQINGRCSQLIGTCVESQQGEKLGKITDVVVSFNNDRASYCVLKIQPGITAQNRLVEVPMAAFQSSADGTHLILTSNKAHSCLSNARAFDGTECPLAVNSVRAADAAPLGEIPQVAVYASQGTQLPPKVGLRPSCDNSRRWDQYPSARTATDAINQMQSGVMYGQPLNSH
jgi:sporulation protein YlmC with PRC-barrel domain